MIGIEVILLKKFLWFRDTWWNIYRWNYMIDVQYLLQNNHELSENRGGKTGYVLITEAGDSDMVSLS